MCKSVLIIGCGVFGLSTAVELAERGYKVTALDAHPVPSPWSAADDYNKIIRCEYSDIVYTKMALEAVQKWKKDPHLKGCYIECGRISVSPLHYKPRIEFDKKSLENLALLGEGSSIEILQGGAELANVFPQFKDNKFSKNERIVYNPKCALGRSAKSLLAMKNKAEKLGVKFIFGEPGKIIRLFDDEGESTAEAADKTRYTADKILACCGALTGYIVDLNAQTSASGLCVAHIKLTAEEYEKYKDIPILFSVEGGYYFPPDPDTKTIKVASATEECINNVKDQFGNTTSLPNLIYGNKRNAVPAETILSMKKFLKKTIPDLANHELKDPKICWINDTNNSDFLIDKIPNLNSAYVASGDSGHAYKFLPTIGKYVSDMMEGKLSLELSNKWKWNYNKKQKKTSWRIEKTTFDLSSSDIDYYVGKVRSNL